MKKIFSLAIAAIAALSMSAMQPHTLFEGTFDVTDWTPNALIKDNVMKYVTAGAIKEGSEFKFYGYRTDNFEEGHYCSIALIDGSWTSVIDGTTGDDRTVLHFNDSAKWVNHELQCDSFTVNATNLPLMAGGFDVTGHGFQLTKVEVTIDETVELPVEITDLEQSVTLWVPGKNEKGEEEEVTIDGWGETTLALSDPYDLFPFNKYYTRVANMYVRLNDNAEGGNMRISGGWDDWAITALPADGYNHIGNMDADYVVKVELTEEFVQKAFVEMGGFTIWGAGFFDVLAIGTTKESVMNPGVVEKGQVAVENVAIFENGKRYNVLGQEVSENYKGVVIMNGQKMIVR